MKGNVLFGFALHPFLSLSRVVSSVAALYVLLWGFFWGGHDECKSLPLSFPDSGRLLYLGGPLGALLVAHLPQRSSNI